MLIYWLLFAVPVVGSAIFTTGRTQRSAVPLIVLFGIFWIFYNIVSGSRYEIGGDWGNYLRIFNYIRLEKFTTSIGYDEVGFVILAKACDLLGLGINGINFFCSAVLSLGVILLARRTEHPWLGIMAAVPYLLIVVGMGYIQQSAAIGFLILAMLALFDRRLPRAICMGALAISMHTASVVFLPLVAYMYVKENRHTIIPLSFLGFLGVIMVVAMGYWDKLNGGYIDAEYSSNGALVRLAMNAIPALIFILFNKNLQITSRERDFWTILSWSSIGLMLLYFVFPSSTVLDRVGLFFTPIQVFAFGNFSAMLRNTKGLSSLSGVALLLYCGAVQFVWLVFADNASSWVPYQSLFQI